MAGGRTRWIRWAVTVALGLCIAVLAVTVVVPVLTDHDPSGIAMPVGDLPLWRQVFTENFTTDVAPGQFPGPYSSRWTSYNGFRDTSGVGYYDQSIISTHDGMLDLHLQTRDGRPLGAAPVPLVTGQWGGQTYGRFSVRFKADPLTGFGTGWLLWPDSEKWNEGEIDFPEGALDGTIHAYNHCVGDAARLCMQSDTGVSYLDWHTATIEWTPERITYLLDDLVVASTEGSVPQTPMHWVLQTATTGVRPAPSAQGHVWVDWVVIYAYDGPAHPAASG